MALKIARMIALIALVISLFVTVDYGINLVNSLVPELQTDGIGYRSVLQSWFGTLDGPFPEAGPAPVSLTHLPPPPGSVSASLRSTPCWRSLPG